MTTPISFTIRPPSAPVRPSPLGNGQSSRNGSWRAGPPSRRHFEQGGDESDEEGEGDGQRSGKRKEEISGFGNGKIIGGQKEPEAMVIAPLPNRDWRQSSMATGARRAPSYRPDTSHRNGPIETHERVGDGPQLSGLRYASKTENGPEETAVKIEIKVEQETVDSEHNITSSTITTTVKSEPLTLEEQALQAILNGENEETETERAQKELVIGMTANEDSVRPVDEADAFRRDVETRPDESTMDDYASIPVSAFGLAIVRGMGYDPSTESPIHIPKARPHLLGIGATPLDVLPPKPGSKKKGEDYKKRTGRGYVPNVLVRKEREGSGSATPAQSSRRTSPGSDSSRRRDDRRDDGRDERRERERDRDRDRDRRSDDRRRETSAERAERKTKERYRERDRETEEERARRKARERNGEGRDERNGDRDRHRDDRDRRRDDRR